jgi:hypothetical protein
MLAIVLTLALQAAPAQATPLSALLREKDQALLDAVATGDRAVWERTLTADATYVDESGNVLTRDQLLAELSPLPPGISGHIAIADYKVRQIGDTAVVVHRDEEREDFHGQKLTANYLTTGTWVRRDGEWKLAMVHVHVMNSDPPAITVPASTLDEYVGRYRAAPDLVWAIRREGAGLVGGREGGTARPLLVEMRDVLFVPGQPRSRKLIQRDAQGRVTGFLDRREGHDIRWTRVVP